MDSIVAKLSEIEAAAVAIVEHAEAQKEVLNQEMDKRRRKFDEEQEIATLKKIQEIHARLEEKTRRILSEQTDNSNHDIDSICKEYKEKHKLYAQEILARITEV
jgi:hypothetical protein